MTTEHDPPADGAVPISTGELVAGRWMGTGGLLGPRGRLTDESADETATDVPAGPTVLLAVEDDVMSESVVRTARRLFGEAADYLAINVGAGPYTQMSWAYVWPVGGLGGWVIPAEPVEDSAEQADAAMQRAQALTARAGLTQATPIGDVGDAASAILRAAHHHHADVVVIGADRRNWVSHLVDPSVERDVLQHADFAVLIAAPIPVTESSTPRSPS